MIWTIEKIKKANKDSGRYFFSPDTMRGFQSKVYDDVYQGPGGVYFVTSEKQRSWWEDHPRVYRVRRFNPVRCDMDSIGPWLETLGKARRRAKWCAEGRFDPPRFDENFPGDE